MTTTQKVIIISPDEKPNQGDFVIRKLSTTLYNIEEANIPIEITDKNTLLVTTDVVNQVDTHPQKAKVETEEYIYRTKNNLHLKFTVKDRELNVEQVS